jgi:hypothetical protein
MTDDDFQYEHVLRHHHTRINSLPVIIQTKKKNFFFDTELHSLYYVAKIISACVSEEMVMHERTE